MKVLVSVVFYAAVLSGAFGHPASDSRPTTRDVREHGLSPVAQPRTQRTFDTNLQIKSTERENHSSHPDITQVILTSSPEYSGEFNVRQDPPPSEDELQRYRRRRGAEAEADSYEEEDDDSDMYMEPMELEKTEVAETKTAGQAAVATEPVVTSADNRQMGQHFFPSFAPVFSLGHSRPHQLFHQEPFYNTKARIASNIGVEFNPFRSYRDNSFKVPINFEDDAISNNILGSGNFGVLRGGTYYNEEDEYRGLYSSHYSNNGHGRPYFSNPRPQKYTNGDFFANFRDFAEINTPTKASYSQYIVVYINKNGTKPEEEGEGPLAAALSPKATAAITKPKNIFEQLTLLDQGDSSPSDYDPLDMENEEEQEEHQTKKTSLHKRKLAMLKQERLNKERKSYYKSKDTGKDFLEPLLALS